jgi:citrate lyase beta subunit
MNLTDIVRRSFLIMPVNRPRFVENAYLRGADAIVLDAERSRRAIEAFEEGVARGMASDSMDGRLSGMPIAEKSHRLRARAQAIAAKDARKAEALRMAGVT